MHARVTTLEGSPDRMDDATRHLEEQALPQLREMDGFKGFIALGDRPVGGLRCLAAHARSSTRSLSSKRPRRGRWAGSPTRWARSPTRWAGR